MKKRRKGKTNKKSSDEGEPSRTYNLYTLIQNNLLPVKYNNEYYISGIF